MRIILLALLAAVAAGSAARAEWAYTRWGMTPEEVASASGGAVQVIPEAQRKSIPEANRRTGAEGTHVDDGIALRVAFTFDLKTNGLNCVLYAVAEEARSAAFTELMVKRFGEPGAKSGLPAIGMSTMSWKKPDALDLQLVTGTPAFVTQCKSD